VKPRGIVLHTVGVKGDTTAAAIRRYHMTPEKDGGPKGGPWRDIGYHRVIRKAGTIELGRALFTAGAHTQGANDTLGICVTGDGDTEAWTLAQTTTVVRLCAQWCKHFGWAAEQVRGHREAPSFFPGAAPTHKTCPGLLVDMAVVRSLIANEIAIPVWGPGPEHNL
jgi:hypothetical protein